MTNPVSNDKISTAYTPSKASSAQPTPREPEQAAEKDIDSPSGPVAHTADLERASARYAQAVQGESSIADTDQARARAAQLRELIGAEPQSALQAHGNITQARVDASLLAP